MKNLSEYIVEAGFKPVKKVQPKTKDELKEIIEETIGLQGNKANLNFIDTSKITLMDSLFAHSKFNGDISEWDVSNVENMQAMFYHSKFNGDISKWDVSNVTNMWGMFSHSKFNGDISEWDISNVTDMVYMFSESNFNRDISKWEIYNHKCRTRYMFDDCSIDTKCKPKIKI
jgi:surface protein